MENQMEKNKEHDGSLVYTGIDTALAISVVIGDPRGCNK